MVNNVNLGSQLRHLLAETTDKWLRISVLNTGASPASQDKKS